MKTKRIFVLYFARSTQSQQTRHVLQKSCIVKVQVSAALQYLGVGSHHFLGVALLVFYLKKKLAKKKLDRAG